MLVHVCRVVLRGLYQVEAMRFGNEGTDLWWLVRQPLNTLKLTETVARAKMF